MVLKRHESRLGTEEKNERRKNRLVEVKIATHQSPTEKSISKNWRAAFDREQLSEHYQRAAETKGSILTETSAVDGKSRVLPSNNSLINRIITRESGFMAPHRVTESCRGRAASNAVASE
jgi:hypothetical protein